MRVHLLCSRALYWASASDLGSVRDIFAMSLGLSEPCHCTYRFAFCAPLSSLVELDTAMIVASSVGPSCEAVLR